MSAARAVEALLEFGVYHNLIEDWDVTQIRNQLYTLLKFPSENMGPVERPFGFEISDTATKILTAMTDDYVARGHMPEDTVASRDLLEAAIMGQLMPRQSEMIARFSFNYAISPQVATEDFYSLCKAANYIQVDRIQKDMFWQGETEYGDFELSVNLSKPEKDPRDIEAERNIPSATYPKCLLCLENVGYAGNRAWPGRQNLRVVPTTIDGGQWYFQYSPYSYYNEHCIVFAKEHKPMEISEATFRQLLDFVKQFPHYFLGSNADLPIVGGSILSHEHFQGGSYTLPMARAECYRRYNHVQYPDIQIGLLKWPLSVIRLSCLIGQEDGLISLASEILTTWRQYSDGDIQAFSGDIPHNTITPIARIRENTIELDIVLRNNRTSDEHPLGIFHPHEEWHHVKKENIGLIEVMGLAILPGRLKTEIEEGRIRKDEIARVFVNVLKDCGVFKDEVDGQVRFDRFMKGMGFTI